MKAKEYNYDIHGLLKINSNFIGFTPDYFLIDNKPKDLDIILRMEKKVEIPKEINYSQIAPGLFYDGHDKSVVSTFRICGFNTTWRLKSLLDNPTEVFVSKAYKDIVRMPISTVHPLNDYIKFILQIKLILKNYSFLLGGGIKPMNTDFAIIISSCGGMGKTTAVINLVKQLGGNFLSDDTVIISKEGVYSYPTHLRIRKFGSLLLGYNEDVPFNKILPKETIARGPYPVKYIFFLERSDKNGVFLIDSTSALNRIISINRKTIPYLSERTILAYFYSISPFSLNKIMEREEKILKDFLEHLDCYVVKCKHPDYYVRLIADIINRGAQWKEH